MLIDARTLDPDTRIKCDLAIIGAGPAGLTIAGELERSGLNIAIIETGSDPAGVVRECGRQAGPGGYSYDLDLSRARGLGGSSGTWFSSGWQARPLESVDFERRDHIPHSGWPITYSELLSYYRRAQEICKLGPFEYDAGYWLSKEARKPDFLVSTDSVETSIMQFGDPTVFTSFRDRMDRSKSINLFLNARVTEIESSDSRLKVSGLTGRTDDGNRFNVMAQTYVLATGGIDNARLLLGSNIGNGNDLVGRYFMEHIHANTGYIRLNKPLSNRVANFYSPHETQGKHKFKGILKLGPNAMQSRKLAGCIIWMYSLPHAYLRDGVQAVLDWQRIRRLSIRAPKSALFRHCISVTKDSPKMLTLGARRLLKKKLPHDAFALTVEAEQVPNPDSRVVLGDDVDRFGMRIPKLQWSLTEYDRYSIRETQEALDDALRSLELGRVDNMLDFESPKEQLGGGCHHMGTTRMHEDPAAGVVDARGQVHGVDNLYVAGSSVFPTGGSSNPTLTVVALSVRLAEHLKSVLTH